MAKNDNLEAAPAADAVTLAGMSDERFERYLRLEVLRLAEANGRLHGKHISMLPADADVLLAYVNGNGDGTAKAKKS